MISEAIITLVSLGLLLSVYYNYRQWKTAAVLEKRYQWAIEDVNFYRKSCVEYHNKMQRAENTLLNDIRRADDAEEI